MTPTNTNVLAHVWSNSSLTSVWRETPPELHIAFIIVVTLAVHLGVKITRHASEWFIRQRSAQKNPLAFVTQKPKFVTIVRLLVSTVTFIVYFLAIGFVLTTEFKLDLTTYLASASVIGLAVSFGSQGLVQDVVIGMTLIFSNVMDVGEIVDLSGTIGRVEEIGLRFTKLINFYDQEVFVPNRNIGNVSRFPHGGIYAYVDIQSPTKAETAKVREAIADIANGLWTQFREIILSEPVVGKLVKAERGGWNFLRLRFQIWPGQQSLIESTIRQQIISAMKTFDPNYGDWMVTIIYRASIELDNSPSTTPTANDGQMRRTSLEAESTALKPATL